MTNLRDEILAAAAGEAIEAVVLGTHYGNQWAAPDETRQYGTAPDRIGDVLTWAEAEPMLNYTYDDGYGGADCHPVYAWTATRVLYVHEYDGATSVRSMPRHPVPGAPRF